MKAFVKVCCATLPLAIVGGTGWLWWQSTGISQYASRYEENLAKARLIGLATSLEEVNSAYQSSTLPLQPDDVKGFAECGRSLRIAKRQGGDSQIQLALEKKAGILARFTDFAANRRFVLGPLDPEEWKEPANISQSISEVGICMVARSEQRARKQEFPASYNDIGHVLIASRQLLSQPDSMGNFSGLILQTYALEGLSRVLAHPGVIDEGLKRPRAILDSVAKPNLVPL